jgi:hypothetical protein
MKHIVFGILLMFLGQALIWFQSHGQFIWIFAKKNPLIISFIGVPVSYLMILATKEFYQGFDGNVWPGRLLGFACGILVFSALSYHIMGEGFSFKTILSLSLAISIVLIQIFVK